MLTSRAFHAAMSARRPQYQHGAAKVLPLLVVLLLLVVVLLGVRSSPQGTAVGPSQVSGDSATASGSRAQQDQVLARLTALGFEDVSLAPGHKAGWYAVSTHQGLYYMDENAEFLLAGQWFSVTNPDAVVNETEQASARMRRTQLAQHQESAIVYGEPAARYQVSVFTDHTCGYCRRMHQMIDEYLAADITIHYYAFPRAGAASQGADQLAGIWCAADAQAALDRAKHDGNTDGLAPPTDECTAQVAQHLQMGRALGVQGTPAMVLPDGRLLTGFRSADALRAELEQSVSEH